MRVLHVSPECFPLVKTGGLADVAGALPLALGRLGVAAPVLLPAYPGVADRLEGVEALGTVEGLDARLVRVLRGRTAAGLDVVLADAPHLFDRRDGGGPYLGPDGRDRPDNDVRFATLAWVAAELATGALEGFGRVDVVHCHDWQAALTPTYLRLGARAAPPTVLTVHNLAFQGLFDRERLDRLRLPVSLYDVDVLEFHGWVSFLKAGLVHADALTTVSPTYAREILTPEHGMGLDGVLRARADRLTGIANGLDTEVWDPSSDPFLARPYTARRLAAKRANREALQLELGLDADPDALLCGVVSRLTEQKGLDLALAALPALLAGGGQLALLGTGEPALEAGWRRAAAAHPGRVAAVVGFDEALAHRVHAGADAMVVPSRFEPCGLTQMSGLRYGAVPIVTRVGGLADTVVDANGAALADGVATGVVAPSVDVHGVAVAFTRAAELRRDPQAWPRLVRRAMSRDVGWDGPARRYAELYARLAR